MSLDFPRGFERAMNLRRGDLARGALLFALMLLVLCTYVTGQVVRDALFLDRFQAARLPYADIAVFVLVSVVVAAYIRAGRRANLRGLLTGSLGLFAGAFVLLWWLARDHSRAWLYPTLYVLVGIFGVLAPAQVWTLANYVLTPREAKRLFGLLGGGATLGAICAGFLSSGVARRFGAESLLLAMAAFLAGATVLVAAVWRLRPSGLLGLPATPRDRETSPRSLQDSVRSVLASPALTAIASLIAISSFVTSVAGWQLKAIAQSALPGKDALAAFFGSFNAWVGILSLVIQLLLTSRLLRRFEIGTVLLILPAALLLGSSAVLLFGTLASVVALKTVDKGVRYAIDRPAVELLYLPLPSSVKVPVKSFIDTVVWRSGDGLAGFAVLIFGGFLGMSARGMSLINLIAILGWLYCAVVNRRLYVILLRESIQKHRLETERNAVPVLDRATTDLLASRLDAIDPREILYALDLFTLGQRPAEHPAVRGLLRHPAQEVRERALAILNAASDSSVQAEAERLLRDPHLGVRTEALLYLARHADVDPLGRVEELGDFPDFSIRAAVVAVLARAGDNLEAASLLFEAMVNETGADGARTRLEAARLARELPDEMLGALSRLVLDPEPEVARAAIRSVAERKSVAFLDVLIRRLGDPALGPDATKALLELGEPAGAALTEALGANATPARLRREIPGLLAALGAPVSAHDLTEHLLEPDTALRLRVISALNKLSQLHPDLALDRRLIETALAAEIMGHYRSYQILGTLPGEAVDEPVTQGLRAAMDLEVERIFRLLSLLFPHQDFHSAHVGLQSANPVIHDQALDFLDSILRPELRSLLLPLIDGEVSIKERLRLATQRLGAPLVNPEQAVAALASSGDPWLRSCAAYTIGALGLSSLAPLLEAWAQDADPLLRETVRQAVERLAAPRDLE
jgi:ATP:ADP antiporter, AAA family